MSETNCRESELNALLYAEQLIKSKLTGFHVELTFYPTGGIIDATGCEDCGTNDNKTASASWKVHRGENILTAIEKLKVKLDV